MFFTIFRGGEAADIIYSLIGGLVVGGLYFSAIFGKYRNTSARHHFETETKVDIKNVRKKDEFVKKFETTDGSMSRANNFAVDVQKLHR